MGARRDGPVGARLKFPPAPDIFQPPGGEGEDDGPRPISVRDLMPEPDPGRRERPSPPRPASGADAEGGAGPAAPEAPGRADREGEKEGEEEGEDAGADVSRPTPVRVAMDTPPPGDSRPMESLPSRTFRARGREWVVRVTGRTVTGTRPDPGAHLMQLEFYHAEEPEEPVRELLTVERSLDALYPEDLEEFLERSRSAQGNREGVG